MGVSSKVRSGDIVAIEIIAFKSNFVSGINTGIKVNGQRLETVTSFKNLGSLIADAQ